MFNNKKIFILGMARSGYEVAKILASRNNNIILNDGNSDQNKAHVKELEDLGVKVILGSHPDDIFTKDFDYLIKNPGITNEHKYVKFAKENNIPVINEIEVVYNLLPKNVSIVGITGTNGKTTTATLIYEVLKKGDRNVHLVGNIGFPVASIYNDIKEGDILVIEISNFQLMNFDKFKTDVSILTNISPAHIDFHGSYENYKQTKKKIFNHHTKKDLAFINYGDEESMELTKDINSTKIYFSSKKKKNLYLEDNNICYNDDKIININDIKVKGLHNYENIMCAIGVGMHFNVPLSSIKEVLTSFTGVEHRIEYVKDINGISIYNDSKATNNKACTIALSAFDSPTVLIMGGLDRGQTFDELTDYVTHVKFIAAFGETKNKIKAFADEHKLPCKTYDNLEKATLDAYTKCNKGDVLLLSPACASWDQYKCFEDRGTEFKKIINNIK